MCARRPGTASGNVSGTSPRRSPCSTASPAGGVPRTYHTAGSLGGGARVGAGVKLPARLVVVADDLIDQFLLPVNDHTGRAALHLRFTPIRVVCQNTLDASLAGHARVQSSLRVAHVGRVADHVAEVRLALGLATRYFDTLGTTLRAMTTVNLTERMLREYWQAILPIARDQSKPAQRRVAEVRAMLTRLFEEGRGDAMPRVRGTAYAAYNAVTDFIDHVSTARRDGGVRQRAAESVLLGTATLKQRAFDEAIALVGRSRRCLTWRT